MSFWFIQAMWTSIAFIGSLLLESGAKRLEETKMKEELRWLKAQDPDTIIS